MVSQPIVSRRLLRMSTLVIDGNHLAHRCRNVFSLSNRGVDVSVTYGFLRVLSSLLSKWKPTSVIVCWDGGIPNYRRVAIPEYKANRHQDEDPFEYEEFLRQIRDLSDYVLPMMGVVVVRKVGVEADDLIAHASQLLYGKVIIITSDKDMLQCVNDNVSMYNPNKEILYTPDVIEKEYGIPVNKLLDWRALQGDGSDNIPGVHGIGEKTASKLIQEFGDISGVYNAAMKRNPKGKLQDKIATSIVSFGWDRLVKNIYVSALYADRTGSRAIIIDKVNNYQPCNKERVKKYLLKNAFMSLIETSFVGQLGKLNAPVLIQGLRTPVVCAKRVSV